MIITLTGAAVGTLATIVIFAIVQAIALAKWTGGITATVAVMKTGQDLMIAAINTRIAEQREEQAVLHRRITELDKRIQDVELNCAACHGKAKP